jgi:uncharacterized membrane protein
MKILKRILIVIAVLILIPLIAAIFVKKEYTVQREVVINKPVGEVYEYVKLTKNQDNYSKWVMADPKMKKDFKGSDGTAGFIYAWDSEDNNVGKGEQEIKALSEGKSIEHEIRFARPFEGKADTYMTTEPVSESRTKVKWAFHSSAPYPMNAMFVVMDMEEILGKDLESSLNNLKNVLEKQ